MKVLVTGATGHVGTNLVRRLVLNGYRVRALVRPTSPRDLLREYTVEECVGDILDEDSVEKAIHGCEMVFHAAAVYAKWAPSPDSILRPTVEGSRKVLEKALKVGVERVVYVSTMGTVGFTTDPSCLLDETTFNTHSRTPYFRAKIEAERHAHEYAKNTGLPVVFVLPGGVFGRYFIRSTPTVQFVEDYLVRGAPFYFEMGMSVVDAEDVAQGAIAAAERGQPGERYLLGGDNIHLKTFYEILARLTGLPGPGVNVPKGMLIPFAALMEASARARNTIPLLTRDIVHDLAGRYGFISSEKARRELGYSFLDAEEVLRRTVEWLCFLGRIPEARRRRMTRWNPPIEEQNP